jgi:hypothetical protein
MTRATYINYKAQHFLLRDSRSCRENAEREPTGELHCDYDAAEFTAHLVLRAWFPLSKAPGGEKS